MTRVMEREGCDLRDTSLLHLLNTLEDVSDRERGACEFLVGPRRYLAARALLVPSDVQIESVATEEMRLRLLTPAGLDRFIASERGDGLKITVHVKTGIAKCVRITFECPKKKGKAKADGTTRSIASEMTLRDLSGLINEVESSDVAADELLDSPRRFFEGRGFLATPEVRFHLTDTEQLREELDSERAVDAFLGRQAAASFDVHIKKGKGKCTKVTIECDK